MVATTNKYKKLKVVLAEVEIETVVVVEGRSKLEATRRQEDTVTLSFER
jgi:hypothetical protein